MASDQSESNTRDNNNIDDWLPITSSRTAKWWFSAFHNVTAMVGAGVLSLPFCMAELGWYVYVNVSSFNFVCTCYYMDFDKQ